MDYKIQQEEFQKFQSLDFIAKQVVEGFITGFHKSPFHGFSVEFAEHRLYNKGESTKHIDWKLFARTDKLFVKRYEEETNLRCQIIIDQSSSMYFPFKKEYSTENLNKISFSVYAAAALVYLFKKQRDAFGLSLFSEDVSLHTRAKSNTVHQNFIYGELEKLLVPQEKTVKNKTAASKALHQVSDSIHKRSLVIIFSDMFENIEKSGELFNALQHLKHNKHEVVLFHVTDKLQEEEFLYDNRPYRFIDVESGEELKINPQTVKKEYVKQIAAFKTELKNRCGQYQIDFIEADINQGFNQILLPYLIKRSKLY